MGNMFYIFIIIAVIQGIVGAMAKAKEKRKKAERQSALRNAGRPGMPSSSSSTIAPPTAPEPSAKPKPGIDSEKIAEAMSVLLGGGNPTPTQSSSRIQLTKPKSGSPRKPDLEELRRRRIEALRRRQGAPNPAAPTPPPAPAAPPVAPQAAAPAVTAREARAARVNAQEARTPATSDPRRSRATSKPRAATASTPRTPMKSGSAGFKSGASLSSRLRGNLRDPRRFREAFVLAELLQPPVSMRKPDASG